jgi:hypothetical protein
MKVLTPNDAYKPLVFETILLINDKQEKEIEEGRKQMDNSVSQNLLTIKNRKRLFW